jgi:hypothetical protein
MKLDRKFLFMAPTIVLAFIAASLFYTTTRLRLIVEASDNLPNRIAYINSVAQGKRQITPDRAVALVRYSLDAEYRRSVAISAANELLMTLGVMTFACCLALLWVISGMPRTLPLRGPVLFRIRSSPEST